MNKTIWFDMDGTIADLYSVDGWLPMLRAYDPTPYAEAKPLVHMSSFARIIHTAQRNGYSVGILSWLSKNSTAEYDKAVTEAKLKWLKKHLPSVAFDAVAIVPYGYGKFHFNNGNDVLFDDEERNRNDWDGEAYDVSNLLRTFAKVTA